MEHLQNTFPNAKVFLEDHHLCHSMGSLLTSPYLDEEVNLYSFDAAGSAKYIGGEKDNTQRDIGEHWASLSIANYKNKQLITLTEDMSFGKATLFGASLGGFYANYGGRSYEKKTNVNWIDINFNPGLAEEIPGKIMGLSAYGNILDVPSPLRLYFSKSNSYTIPIITSNHKEYNEDHLNNIILQSSGEDIAAWTQHCFEKIVLEYFSKLPKQIKKNKLCLGGGCALNILLNSKILEEGLFDDIHIPTAPNDDGLHQGAALLKAWELEKQIVMPTNIGCIGLEYSDSDILKAIEDHNLKYYPTSFFVRNCHFTEVLNYAATSLKNNKIIGWYQGRSEFGPRALGNRSILANPCYDNRQYLNTKVKKREEWRPYAAVVLEEYVDEWFDTPKKDSYYMLFSAKVKTEKLGLIPAVTHIDHSCRIQVVNREQNEKLYLLLKKFYELTGVPILLNTSFNTIPKEPIVETPYDAINSFINSKIDLVVLHNIIIERNYIPNDINIEYA